MIDIIILLFMFTGVGEQIYVNPQISSVVPLPSPEIGFLLIGKVQNNIKVYLTLIFF